MTSVPRGFASTATTADTLHDATAETNRRFEAAVAAGDAAGAAREVYTRDARVMPPGAATVLGREAAARFWAGAATQLGITRVELETMDLQALGDGAYEVGRAVLTVGSGQQVVAKYVVLWREDAHVDRRASIVAVADVHSVFARCSFSLSAHASSTRRPFSRSRWLATRSADRSADRHARPRAQVQPR